MPDRFLATREGSRWFVQDTHAAFDATLRKAYPAASRQDARRMVRELNEQWAKMPKTKVSLTPSV